ncbi:site-specific integrase [Rhodoglobus vestalii]|uniref:site-specific integrase n=1 Tax=Rhodoglobus vestalii TaxID=193384 RepID=UPI003CCC64CD
MRAPQIGFPQLVQDFFLQRLITQRGASARTVESYRDAFELLFGYLEKHAGTSPSALQMADLDAPLVLDFLDHLETERHNSARTRNARLGSDPFLHALRSSARPGFATSHQPGAGHPGQTVRPSRAWLSDP